MGVVGGGHHNGVHVFEVFFEHLPEISVALYIRVFLIGCGGPAVIHVAEGHVLDFSGAVKAFHHAGTPAADSESRHIQGVAGGHMAPAKHIRGNDAKGSGCRCRVFQEGTSLHG